MNIFERAIIELMPNYNTMGYTARYINRDDPLLNGVTAEGSNHFEATHNLHVLLYKIRTEMNKEKPDNIILPPNSKLI